MIDKTFQHFLFIYLLCGIACPQSDKKRFRKRKVATSHDPRRTIHDATCTKPDRKKK